MRIGLYLLSGVLILILTWLGLETWFSVPIKSFAEVQKSYQASDVLVLDRNDYPLEVLRIRDHERSLAWTAWSQVSPSFQKLLVQTEDKRFFEHHGVDSLALFHSLYQVAFKKAKRGASTLSMQLIHILNPNQRHQSFIKDLITKFRQIINAKNLEKTWSKNEILEAYINKVSFRGELVGLGAASFGYFNKSPEALDDFESAFLTALIRSPNSNAQKVSKRICQILSEHNCAEVEVRVNSILKKDYHITRNMDHLPVLSELIFDKKAEPISEKNLKTSLDIRIQDLALQALREQLLELKNKNVNEGAILVLENKTGTPIVYIGNPGAQFTSFPKLDGIQAKRQVGSTIKALIYASAFDLNILNVNSLLEDTKEDISLGGGQVYHPKNYDRIFRGNVGAGEALASSLNVPAVRTLALVGEQRILENLKSLGFKSLQDDDFYGPSLALGSLDASLWEMTQSYRALASGELFSKSATEQIFQALALPEYRRFTFGLDNILTLPFLAAVKTGTSKDMRDNWCIGWTQQYTVGVWVGNFNGQAMWNVSGTTGAAPIWRKIMLALHPNHTGAPMKLSYQPASPPILHRSITRIRYPVEEMKVGLDPDIPLILQKIPIEIENPQPGQSIYLNGVSFGPSKEMSLWPLKKGRQSISLRSNNGEILDQVKFEVR